MSAFAWWEWIAVSGLVGLAWLIGYSAGEYYGREKAARIAADKIMKTLETLADKQNSGVKRMNMVCELFRETAILLRKIANQSGGDS